MENENKKTFEIIIKRDGETVVQEKTNAIFCIINHEQSVKQCVFFNKISNIDLLYLLDAAQEIIDNNLEKRKELKAIWSLHRLHKLIDKVGKNEE